MKGMNESKIIKKGCLWKIFLV